MHSLASWRSLEQGITFDGGAKVKPVLIREDFKGGTHGS
jgi:hypothetical protein